MHNETAEDYEAVVKLFDTRFDSPNICVLVSVMLRCFITPSSAGNGLVIPLYHDVKPLTALPGNLKRNTTYHSIVHCSITGLNYCCANERQSQKQQ